MSPPTVKSQERQNTLSMAREVVRGTNALRALTLCRMRCVVSHTAAARMGSSCPAIWPAVWSGSVFMRVKGASCRCGVSMAGFGVHWFLQILVERVSGRADGGGLGEEVLRASRLEGKQSNGLWGSFRGVIGCTTGLCTSVVQRPDSCSPNFPKIHPQIQLVLVSITCCDLIMMTDSF